LYTTHDIALSELAIAFTAGDAMTHLKPEQSGDGRRSQVYLLRLWREAPEAPWRLSLREASNSQSIGFADLDDLVIFLLRTMGNNEKATPDEEQRTSWIG
jgi:hypothetical protein